MKVRTVTMNEVETVDEFLAKYSYPDEPLAMSVPTDDIPKPGVGFASKFAPQGLSRMIVDDDGSILGVCLNDTFPQRLDNIYTFTDFDEKFQNLFDHVEKVSRVMEIAPDAMELRVLAVCPAARKRGVAAKLVEESVSVAKSTGFSWVKVYCTSAYSSRLIAKRGWTLIYSRSYKDLRENVVQDLPYTSEPHNHLDLYIKATND